MRATRTTALLSLGIAGLMLAGCTSTPEAEPEAPTENESTLFYELPQELQDKGVLTFAGDTHPPYRTVESGGEVTGIDPDFQALLAKELGIDIEIEITSGLPAILSGMLSGRYDAFNGPVRSTPEREAEFDSIVWMTTRSSYVFLEANAKKIPDSEALCGLKIAGVTGSVTETQVAALNKWCEDEGEKPAEFVGLADTNATILAVQSERVDALATTETAALDVMDKTPDTFEYVTQTDEQGAGVDLMAMMAPKTSGLGPVLFKAVENIYASGEYEKFMEKWKLESVALEAPQFNPTTSK